MSDDSDHNRLAQESSPYLLQHADNPVDWYPWGEEAFAKAKEEDKPVFLSIGYATCHWCHVMAHESFEDEDVAAMMNQAFVNIKVDREERPDIDKTYMLVCQMLSGSGGWPLNVLLTPDKKPFYAATYIPKQGRQGHPGMRELIPWISQLWRNEREKVLKSTDNIQEAFQKSNDFTASDQLGANLLDKAYQQFSGQFDTSYGGFGSAPKFPAAHNLMFLLRYHQQHDNSDALRMVQETLTQMRMGGIFDHIGLGFHRYSTDREWLLPHFEKMLYDQAMLLMVYIEGWQCTNQPLFEQTAREIISYLLRKMQHPKGGFYSAEDADSEGEEGKFYVWSPSEIRDVLPTAKAELAIEVFNIIKEGNYTDEATGRRTGKSIPHLKKSVQELADERNMEKAQLQEELESIRKELLQKRQERVAPLLDDKILTDWNGLVIAALAKAGRALNEENYIRQAEQCFRFISEQLIDENGTLYHRFREGKAGIEAHADDYAFLIWGLIELYEATYTTRYLEQAVQLNQQFIDRFWDNKQGGFYFTDEAGEELLGRKKEIYDGALPSSNSIAMLNLLRLGRMTGNTEWEEMADQINRLFSSEIRQAPTGFGAALQGVSFAADPTSEIIISGQKEEPLTRQMTELLSSRFLPNAVTLLHSPEDEAIPKLIPYLSDFEMQGGKPTAYVCQNYSCELPTNDPAKMLALIQSPDE
ncbi:thioredoxin domain-containing protein [Fodinibius salsisoli]|uniref:Thioredoxin domain-containing protein n=1 Tax=Fodinibius salsisoli TaxID=2820877 RepID=A0ABT3PPJ4_9BACT|nr:thioredoxin domain-containing protein [Fodinibius salsisoli]MCW9707784.1 thioredoxin domain-containing protein [Fodinibius salsisoli]